MINITLLCLQVYRAQLEAKRKMGRFKVKRIGPREKEIKDDDTGPHLNIIVKGMHYS